ncbi:MAG: hypothetical protein J6U97_02805 [Bacteroidaceae bacterium]|nr:hypothetical protein [Bacteroidaceae bacterium]
MEVNALSQIIMTIGFPIVACCACGWFIFYMTKAHREELQRFQDLHNTEIKEITAAINNNTLALQKLVDKIGGMEDE